MRPAMLLIPLLSAATLLAQPAPRAPENVPCTAFPMTIQHGTLVTCTTTAAATHTYNFAGLSGEQVRISAGPWGTPPVIELWNQTPVKVATGTTGSTETQIVHRLASTGTYSIRLSVNYARSYSLSLERIVPTPSTATQIALGQTIADEINPQNDVDLYQLAGTSGSRIQLTVARRSGNEYPAFELYDPNGLTVAADYSSSGTVTATVQLLANGPHVIAVWSRLADNIMPYTVTVACVGSCFSATLDPISASAPALGMSGSVAVTASPPTQAWSAFSNVPWITITSGAFGAGNGTVTYVVAPNLSPSARIGTLTIAGLTFTVNQAAGSNPKLWFVPVTPCRLVDTRDPARGLFGAPSMAGGTTRDFPVPLGPCGIPAGVLAYSFNVTVVPAGPLGYLTIWPTGQPQPVVSTLNSFDGRVVANAAIVPAGVNGSVSVFVTHPTDVILDINGYFTASTGPEALSFYKVAPCRAMDTRPGAGMTGPFGPPPMAGGATRDLPISAGHCGIPTTARACVVNITVVPSGPLGYLSAWSAGSAQPVVSTLNSFTGSVVSNMAIVPCNSGNISLYVYNPTDVIVDISGYFAPPGFMGLAFYTAPPCRVADTRDPSLGQFGPPSLTGGVIRNFPIPLSTCSIPGTAQAYSFNATVVPPGPLGYLTLWGAGSPQPVVSTLNSFEGRVVANGAIVPAGINGAISAFASHNTELILDINGYFAP